MIIKIWQNSNVNINEQPVKVLLNPNVQVPVLKSYPPANLPLSDTDKIPIRQGNDWREVKRKELKEVVHRVDLTGTELDWKSVKEYVKTLTENATFTDVNLPTGTETGLLILHLTGDFAVTFPSYWQHKGGEYDGSKWNMIVADCLNGNAGDEKVNFTILTDE